MVYKGKKVLITGGASGIGKLMAEMLLKEGATVIIGDISPRNIDITLNELFPMGKISANRVY